MIQIYATLISCRKSDTFILILQQQPLYDNTSIYKYNLAHINVCIYMTLFSHRYQ